MKVPERVFGLAYRKCPRVQGEKFEYCGWATFIRESVELANRIGLEYFNASKDWYLKQQQMPPLNDAKI